MFISLLENLKLNCIKGLPFISMIALSLFLTSCENGIPSWSNPSVIGADLSPDERSNPQISSMIDHSRTLNLAAVSRDVNTITSGPVQGRDCEVLAPIPSPRPQQQIRDTTHSAADNHSGSPFESLSSSARRSPISLWATHYHTPVYSVDSGGVALKNMSENSITYRGSTVSLSRRRWCMAAMEGSVTIRMSDGQNKTYNYSGVGSMQTDCTIYFNGRHSATGRVKFSEVRSVWGLGVRNYSLIPYRTIAVDPSVIPYGSVVFIQDAVGKEITLADGTTFTHDGYFFAGDTGGAIKQNHIDVFTGNNAPTNFSFIRSQSSGTFNAQIVHDEELKSRMLELHRREY